MMDDDKEAAPITDEIEAEAEPAGGPDDAAARIAALEAEAADLRDRLLREMAEMENLRKRARRETEDAARYAIARFARDLVTVADNLRRALEAVPGEARSEGGDALAALIEGVGVTERSFEQILERHGVKRFDPAGEKFDPERHEAMFEVPDQDKPAGTVAHVVESGYTIGDRMLRPARVGVSKGGPKSASSRDPAAGAGAEGGAGDPAHGGQAASDAQEASERTKRGGEPQRIGLKIDKSA
jgi:molecular chaperone GrpE